MIPFANILLTVVKVAVLLAAISWPWWPYFMNRRGRQILLIIVVCWIIGVAMAITFAIQGQAYLPQVKSSASVAPRTVETAPAFVPAPTQDLGTDWATARKKAETQRREATERFEEIQ